MNAGAGMAFGLVPADFVGRLSDAAQALSVGRAIAYFILVGGETGIRTLGTR
jgi:hypothetical protein